MWHDIRHTSWPSIRQLRPTLSTIPVRGATRRRQCSRTFYSTITCDSVGGNVRSRNFRRGADRAAGTTRGAAIGVMAGTDRCRERVRNAGRCRG